MNQHKEDLKQKIIEKKGIIFICGNNNTMVKGAEEVLGKILGDESGLKDLVKEERYKKEVWYDALV